MFWSSMLLPGFLRRLKRRVIKVTCYRGMHMSLDPNSFRAFNDAFEGRPTAPASAGINIVADQEKLAVRYLMSPRNDFPRFDVNITVPCPNGRLRDWHVLPANRVDVMWASIRQQIGMSGGGQARNLGQRRES